MTVDVPEEYQEVLAYLDQVRARLVERYKRATKLDAYKYRILAAEAVAERLMDAPRPELRMVPGGLAPDRPLLKELPAWYATMPRYNRIPSVPQIEAVFSRWESLALAPIRFFARPEGLTVVDASASVLSEVGLARDGVIVPAGRKPGEARYVFCDRSECFEVPFEVDEQGEDWVAFDFTGLGVRIAAAPATDEILEDCNLHDPVERAKAVVRLAATWNWVVGSSVWVTVKRAVESVLEGNPSMPSVQSVKHVFANHVVAAACGRLASADYDEWRVTKVYVCTRSNPYVLDVYSDEVPRRVVHGVGGYQYWTDFGNLPPYVPPCGDYNQPPGGEYPPML